MRFLITSVLFLLLNTSCAGTETVLEITPSDIRGSIPANTEAGIFDGTSLKTIPVSNNKLVATHGITSGLQGVLFFTKHGHYPETIIFKAQNQSVKIDKVSLVPLKDMSKGILTGVVYKPVSGGKLKEYKGIFQLFKEQKITVIQDTSALESMTDNNGVFTIELLPGEYDIVFTNKSMGKAFVTKGKTTIMNIQKGLVLRD